MWREKCHCGRSRALASASLERRRRHQTRAGPLVAGPGNPGYYATGGADRGRDVQNCSSADGNQRPHHPARWETARRPDRHGWGCWPHHDDPIRSPRHPEDRDIEPVRLGCNRARGRSSAEHLETLAEHLRLDARVITYSDTAALDAMRSVEARFHPVRDGYITGVCKPGLSADVRADNRSVNYSSSSILETPEVLEIKTQRSKKSLNKSVPTSDRTA